MSLVKRTYVDQETVITAENLNAIQDAIIENEEAIEDQGEAIEGKYSKPAGGIPATDMASGVQTSLDKADSAYQKPSGGIPASDMASGVQTSLDKADSAYQKPSGGIPASDMASGVQTSLDKADSAYQKPSGGIPASDMASGVQTSLGKADSALQSSDIDNTLAVAGKAADAKKTGDEISDVKNTLTNVETSVTNIQQHKRKILFVGDSYGTQDTNWVDVAASTLGLTSSDYINASVSGTGFVCDGNGNIGANYNGFLAQIQGVTTGRDTFTDVVICGGINDAQYDTVNSAVTGNIENTISYIKANFHNAIPHIGFIGGALNSSPVLSGRNFVRQEVARYSYINHGAPYYLNGVENAIHQSGYCYSSDKLHPSAVGSELIGESVASAIMTGYVETKRPEEIVSLSAPSGWSINDQLVNYSYDNDVCKVTVDSNFVSSQSSSNSYGISTGIPFTLDSNIFFNKKAVTNSVLFISPKTGSRVVIDAKIEFYENTMTVYPVFLSGTAWGTIAPAFIGFPCGVELCFPSYWIN